MAMMQIHSSVQDMQQLKAMIMLQTNVIVTQMVRDVIVITRMKIELSETSHLMARLQYALMLHYGKIILGVSSLQIVVVAANFWI